MNTNLMLGTDTTYEVWLTRYNAFAMLYEGFSSSEAAIKHATNDGFNAENLRVVKVTTERWEVLPQKSGEQNDVV